MRRQLKVASLLAAVALAAAACGTKSGGGSGSGGSGSGGPFKVAYMVPGNLGDLGFFDSGERGIKEAQQRLGAQTKTVQGGTDPTTWSSDLQQLSQGGYNVIVTGSDQVAQQITAAAKRYPSQKYIMFDQDIPAPNIASIVYLQNDGAFLAGVLAALATTHKSQFPLAKGSKVVGIVGGVNIPVIQDFVVGFEKGAHTVDPSIKVLTSYVGNFDDPQTGYNQAVDMYHRGADVVFAAAGASGLGVLKASKTLNRYSIGVDSDQNNTFPGHVLASDLKNVNVSVFDLLSKAKAGTLKYNHQYVYGLSNNGVKLLLDSKLVPSSISSQLDKYSKDVASGKISVPCVKPYCLSPTG